jgi:hypothetical protein
MTEQNFIITNLIHISQIKYFKFQDENLDLQKKKIREGCLLKETKNILKFFPVSVFLTACSINFPVNITSDKLIL